MISATSAAVERVPLGGRAEREGFGWEFVAFLSLDLRARVVVCEAVATVLDDHADRIGVMDADVESVLDGILELLQRAPFQESQDADELARSQAARLRLQQPAERGETLWQVPLLERLGMIEASRLLLK